MRLGYVCTTFGDADHVAAALRSLETQERHAGPHEVQVVIVDNGSGESVVARLRALAEGATHVTLLEGHGNVGYFAGLNLGLHHLRAARPDIEHVVVGNDDLTFPAGFLDAMAARRALFDAWAVVSPALVSPHGRHQNPLVRRPITRARRAVWAAYFSAYPIAAVIAQAARLTHGWTARPERTDAEANAREAGPVLQGYGACYILGPRFFRHFTRLYAPTFLMREEYFLSEQLAAIGQRPYYEPGLVVGHRDHATFGRLPGRRVWELTRDAHRVMVEHERMEPGVRAARILAVTGTGNSARAEASARK